MNKYLRVDIRRLLLDHIPIVLRRPLIIAWIESWIRSLQLVYNQFVDYWYFVYYDLNHNSQVCYMRSMLNDFFDVSLRRITIDDGIYYDRKFIYMDIENKPKFLKTYYIYPESAYSDTGYDFIVQLNGVVLSTDQLNKMKNLLNYYKLAGKRYKIIP